MVELISYADAWQKIERIKSKYLLLGNGFSIALRPDIFSYDSLYENADFSKSPHIPELFSALETTDFETVIHQLQGAAEILQVYEPSLSSLKARWLDDAEAIKSALVSAVAKRHPERPYEIEPAKYAACRAFMLEFNHIFTLNYDVLLYWALMQDEVDDLDLMPDDGFRHPEDDPDLPYVSWQQSHSATVHYIHGALHLFDRGHEITKYTWSKTDMPIVDQIRDALDDDKFPIFVSEGDTESKKNKIMHNAYLHKALRSFEGCMRTKAAALVVFGHSLAANDKHVLRLISKGNVSILLVGIHGDPDSKANQKVISNANTIVSERAERRAARPLELVFFDSQSASVWG
jgi:hypothetical protein